MREWERMQLLNVDEVRHCVRKILHKEPFTTKKDMIGSLHHVTTHRYMRVFEVENPLYDQLDRSYRLSGKKRVDEHNELMLEDLYREGFIRYEKHSGSYNPRGKKYHHFIMKIVK